MSDEVSKNDSVEIETRTEGTNSQERPLLQAIREKSTSTDELQEPSSSHIYLSPPDEGRRFPLLTKPRAVLIAAVAFLLLIACIVAFLLWRQQTRDTRTATISREKGGLKEAAASVTPTPEASPAMALTDQAILEAVKTAVSNYNPPGFGKYAFEINQGVVTINGEAETQPEKDGVENVVRPLPGVKAIVNNLVVRLNSVMTPVKLNQAEAKRLDEAMRKQLEQQASTEPKVDPEVQKKLDADREADRKRRDLAAAKNREEDDRTRREEEDRLNREAADYQRRIEEMRTAEAQRRARAEQAKLETSVLKLGTIAWSGMVDGVAEIVISGNSASVRSVSGEMPREVKSSFSAPVPHAPVQVNLVTSTGRGAVSLAQQPSASNGYTAIVRVDDSAKSGFQRYEFTLRWPLTPILTSTRYTQKQKAGLLPGAGSVRPLPGGYAGGY